METSTASTYAFVEDLRAEGTAAVLDRVLGTYGCDTLTVAAAYHRARDVTPHGPARVTCAVTASTSSRPPTCSTGCG
ncbi:hypothetical protein [Streptomyces griseoruber]|uniref:hypothetical protein n=1 Tax=Streptomyces griseoruber TaxID=1943 RepID=UPI00378F21C4